MTLKEQEMAEELVNLVGAVDRQRSSIIALSTALKDAISTYGQKEEIVVTAERQEAWQAILDEHGVSNENRPKSFHDIAMAMKHSAHVADLESEIDLLRGALTKIQLECSPRSFTTPEEYEAVQKFISETLKSKEND